MTMIFLGIMWLTDLVGGLTGANVSHIIDQLNICYYTFLDHPALNAILFTGVLLIIAAILFSKLEQEIKGGAK